MPGHSPATAPASWYRDPQYWSAERARLFARTWQFVTHESALSAPGAWCADVLAGYPILLVRDLEGVLRGVHNVCRHRAGPLVKEDAGVCDGSLATWRYLSQ